MVNLVGHSPLCLKEKELSMRSSVSLIWVARPAIEIWTVTFLQYKNFEWHSVPHCKHWERHSQRLMPKNNAQQYLSLNTNQIESIFGHMKWSQFIFRTKCVHFCSSLQNRKLQASKGKTLKIQIFNSQATPLILRRSNCWACIHSIFSNLIPSSHLMRLQTFKMVALYSSRLFRQSWGMQRWKTWSLSHHLTSCSYER